VIGRRVYPTECGQLWFRAGDYAFDERNGHWMAMCPVGHLGDLSQHEVVENADGTISVSPSILITGNDNGGVIWHGFLENGVWREAP
jgi:hypothetical protein